MPDNVLTEVNRDTHVATLTLNNPDKLNAFDRELVDAWAEGLALLAADREVHAIVITGAGKAFCAGGDLATLAEDAAPIERKRFLTDHVHRVERAMRAVEQPVIAMINGAAMGAGLDMALLCDLRIAAEDAKLGEAYARLGLVPGDGGAWLLPRLIGPARALELLWTGRVLTGAEAADWGLVNSAVSRDRLSEETYALAERLAAGPQLAQRLIKKAVYGSETMTRGTHFDHISSLMAVAQSSPDFGGAVEAVSAGERPHFPAGDPRP
ncbi:MAG: enoyl-CoA hydratase/isomerase family protein [Actinobacteria bacterium]|nr:enoyl-CoA hydratase/isomerase family protein [Actinomycetota bacterium]